MTLEWNNGVGQFGRFSIPHRTMDNQGWAKIPSYYYDAQSAPAQQRFQPPSRMGPGPTPLFKYVRVFLVSSGQKTPIPGIADNIAAAVGWVPILKINQLLRTPPFRGGGYSLWPTDNGYDLYVQQGQLVDALRLLGLGIISTGMSGPLQWNSSLGAPIQLIKGNRYQSRWLVAIPPPAVNQPQQSCTDVVANVQKALFSMSSQQGWPWQSLGAYGAFSQIPAGWPSDMRTFPFEHPGACLVFLDGVWGAPTTTVDGANLPTIPGARAMDFRNGTTGQKLVEEPHPGGSPCAPADLTFDIVNGIFKCAGQIIPALPAPPLPTIPAIPAPPVFTPPVINPTQPPITVTPTGEKKEEKSSALPWVIGGGVLLLGGAFLLSR